MPQRKLQAASLLLFSLLLFAGSAQAAPIVSFPWPPPGSPTFVDGGGTPGGAGGLTWSYNNWNTSEYVELYFAPGYRGAGLDGNAHDMAFSGIAGQTASWTVTSPYTSPGGPGNLAAGNYNIDLTLNVTVTGYGATPWLDATTIPDIDPGFDPGLGALVDTTAGNDFTVVFAFVATLPGIGTVAMNDVAQGPPGGQTQTSIGGSWYGVVPEPGTALLVGSGLALLGARRRRPAF